VPLTILIARNKGMKKGIKIALIALAWLLYLSIAKMGNDDESPEIDTIQGQVIEEETDQQIETDKVEIDDSDTEKLDAAKDDGISESTANKPVYDSTEVQGYFSLSMIQDYSGNAYVSINDNNPFFADSDLTTVSYESYSPLDSLGRCGACVACIGTDLMPTGERGDIGDVKPSGWKQAKYSGIVDGNYLYNRCHLIGWQLTGENANTRNLITGTRYLNTEGMLPFENMVADYVKETGCHVLYRVTPVFDGNNLLASGVLMEGKSVEDNGASVLFCVFCYNVQPGITIDYTDGSSELDGTVNVD